MTATTRQSSPPEWGKDPLTGYFDNYLTNQYATFANKDSEVDDLITIDGMFLKLLDGATNPRPFIPMAYLLRAHAAFRAAAGAVMAGQIYEAQALLRVCLEQGAYSHYVGDDKARWELWMNRHNDEASMKAVRAEFTHGKISKHISAAHSGLGAIYTQLYNQTIDYGAHPNERGSSLSSMTVDTEDGGKKFLAIYLHGDGRLLDFGLRTTAQVGLWVLRIAQEIYPTRTQALGLPHTIADMSKRF